MLSRRDFVAGLAATVMVPGAGQGRQPEPLWRARIPASGETIARVGLGTWQTFDVGASADERRTLAQVLSVFTASGASVIDTSPMYGSSESVLGDLLAAGGHRSGVFLATKVWTTGRAEGVAQIEASSEKLRSRNLDLIQIHNLVDWRTQLRTLRLLKDEGRIRYIGITHYQAAAIGQVAEILRAEPVDFLQLNLSLDEPEAAGRILPLAADRGVAFLANRPFGGGGALRRVRQRPLPSWAADYQIDSWAQFMLKWVLGHPEVTCAIPGTGNPRHLADNLAAARGPLIDRTTLARLERAWRDA